MKFLGVFSICIILNSYQCATILSAEKTGDADYKINKYEFRLPPEVADNTDYSNRDDQHNPSYSHIISEDHLKPLDNLLLEEQEGNLEQTVKEKRCKTEGIVGRPSILSLGRRDTAYNLLRKSCDSCMNSPLCKTRGKCDGCKKICDKLELSLDQSAEEMQMDEMTNPNSEQGNIVGVPNRIGDPIQQQDGLSYGENRYYTVGSFPPGPVHHLLAKLLNIKDVEPIEQLLILAKTKSVEPIRSVRPVVIDTAHVFTLNHGRPSKLDVEIHEVGKTNSEANTLASELDKEIEKAMNEKKKITGTTHLAPDEIDRIILKKLGQDPISSPKVSSRYMDEGNEDETVACKDKDGKNDSEENSDMYLYKPGHSEYRENQEMDEEDYPKEQKIKAKLSPSNDDTFQRLVAQERYPEENMLGQQHSQDSKQLPLVTDPIHQEHQDGRILPIEKPKQLHTNILPTASPAPEQRRLHDIPTQDESQEHREESAEDQESRESNEEELNIPITSPHESEDIKTTTPSYTTQHTNESPIDQSLNNNNHPSETEEKFPITSTTPASSTALEEKKKTQKSKTKLIKDKLRHLKQERLHQQKTKVPTKEEISEQYNEPQRHNSLVNKINEDEGLVHVEPEQDLHSSSHILDPDKSAPQQIPSHPTKQPQILRKDPIQQMPDLSINSQSQQYPIQDTIIESRVDDDQTSKHDIVGKMQSLDESTKVNNRFQDEELPKNTENAESFEEKYHKLRQWVMSNSHVPPPELQRGLTDTRYSHAPPPRLQEEVKDIIDATANINKDISSIIQNGHNNPNIVQMVKENDEKLKAMDKNDRNEHIIGFPNMNKFRTNIVPDTQRKIDQIFANEKPVGNQRNTKDPYEEHPRKITEYVNGKWMSEKLKPNKPPYTSKYRALQPVDQQNAERNVYNKESKTSEPVYIDPKLLNTDSIMKGLKDTPKLYYDKKNKVVGVKGPDMIDDDLNVARTYAEKHIPRKMTKPITASRHYEKVTEKKSQLIPNQKMELTEPDVNSKLNTDTLNNKHELSLQQQDVQNDAAKLKPETEDATQTDSKEDLSAEMNKSNETVACSKEEEEEILEVLHEHPLIPGAYRSSEHSHPRPLPETKLHQTHKEEPKASGENTEDLSKYAIDGSESSNKMQKHGKTKSPEEIANYQSRNENQNINEQQSYIPPIQEPAARNDYGYFSPPSEPSYPAMRTMPEMPEDANMDPNFMEQPMMFNGANTLERQLVGDPMMRNRLQLPYSRDLVHMGKFIPRNADRTLSLHSRDVSDQEKRKNVYFIGDGIKLPLNMKEHDDGSLHLSVDVKSLCNCKHCRGKQLENGTIILEALPLTEEERREHEQETQNKVTTNKDLTLDMEKDAEQEVSEEDLSSEELENLENQDGVLVPQAGNEEIDISKRSPRTKNSLQDNEIDRDSTVTYNEDTIIPMKPLSTQEILDRLGQIKEKEKKLENIALKDNDSHKHISDNDEKFDSKYQLLNNVLNFMKKVALDAQMKK